MYGGSARADRLLRLPRAARSAFQQNLLNGARYARRARLVLFPNRYGETGILRARFNDAVFISPSHKYLFASNEKAANSTLRATFQTLEAGGALPPLYKPFKRWTGPLAQPSDVGDFETLIIGPSFKKFCVVRDPYARLVSCYRDKLERGSRGKGYRRMMRELGYRFRSEITFAEFVHAIAKQHHSKMNPHWRIQYFNVFMDLIVYDEIIRFEDIGERLPNIIAELHPCAAADGNATSAIISRKRNDRTAEEYVAAYFTDELRQIVDHIYRLDFETFDFERLGSRTASPARVPAKARSPHLEAALARA